VSTYKIVSMYSHAEHGNESKNIAQKPEIGVDWRLPNQKELRTIAARNCYNPSINVNVFPNTPDDWFWSSSPVAGDVSSAWAFSSGFDNYYGRDNNYRVRLVRSLGQ